MKIYRRQVEELTVTGPNSERKETLDKLASDGYNILKIGPRIRKDGWSFDVTQFQIKAAKPLTKFRFSKQL